MDQNPYVPMDDPDLPKMTDEELAQSLSHRTPTEDLDLELARALQAQEDEESRPSLTTAPIAPRKQSLSVAKPQVKSLYERFVNSVSSLVAGVSDSQESEELTRRRNRVEVFKQKRDRQNATVFNVVEIGLPPLVDDFFVVSLPDGAHAAFRVEDGLKMQVEPMGFPFDGERQVRGGDMPAENEEEQQDAFLDYYRFNPSEVEMQIPIIPGPRPLGGMEMCAKPEGVFMKWALFGVNTEQDLRLLDFEQLPRAGDLIVMVGDTPTPSLEILNQYVSSVSTGSKVLVRALRKSIPIVRCPAGHALVLDDPRAEIESECHGCLANWGRHHCAECAFSLCPRCFAMIFDQSKARYPIPVNNDHEFKEAPLAVRLQFSQLDVGLKVLVYWHTTAEWWIGQIESYDPVKGHVVVYEERNGKLCRETIANFAVREYRILTECTLMNLVATFHDMTLGPTGGTATGASATGAVSYREPVSFCETGSVVRDANEEKHDDSAVVEKMAAAPSAAAPPVDDSFVLNDDEASMVLELLRGQQAVGDNLMYGDETPSLSPLKSKPLINAKPGIVEEDEDDDGPP